MQCTFKCSAKHVFKTFLLTIYQWITDLKAKLVEGERIFCWTFQNRDYHNRRVVECEIAEWCSVNDSATEKTLTIKSFAFFSYPVCENKMSVVALDDKRVEVLRDTKQQ